MKEIMTFANMYNVHCTYIQMYTFSYYSSYSVFDVVIAVADIQMKWSIIENDIRNGKRYKHE